MDNKRWGSEVCEVICARDGRIIEMSAAFARTFCRDPDAVVGSYPPFPWWPPKLRESYMQLLHATLGEPGRVYSGVPLRFDVRTTAGNIIPILCRFERLEDGTTRFLHEPQYGDAALAELVEKAIEIGDLTRRFEERTDGSLLTRRLESLSPRESTVLHLLLRGRRAAQIADNLHISVHTVRNHRKAIFEKLDVRSQVELMGKFGR